MNLISFDKFLSIFNECYFSKLREIFYLKKKKNYHMFELYILLEDNRECFRWYWREKWFIFNNYEHSAGGRRIKKKEKTWLLKWRKKSLIVWISRKYRKKLGKYLKSITNINNNEMVNTRSPQKIGSVRFLLFDNYSYV